MTLALALKVLGGVCLFDVLVVLYLVRAGRLREAQKPARQRPGYVRIAPATTTRSAHESGQNQNTDGSTR
jgi:hypothetical protein